MVKKHNSLKRKFESPYDGPLKIVNKLGQGAYKIQLLNLRIE
jgi:hypothetical protein